jgi:hypothetical protein
MNIKKKKKNLYFQQIVELNQIKIKTTENDKNILTLS